MLDKKGAGKTSDVIRALEFAVANKDRFGIKVVNLSLGHPIFESAATDPLVQAVEAAVRSGIIVVTAAGNYGTNPTTGVTGYAGIASPGNAPSAITVGASNTGGTDRPRRRPRRAVQLARSVVVRRHRQAGRRRAGRRTCCRTKSTAARSSTTYPTLVVTREVHAVPAPEWHPAWRRASSPAWSPTMLEANNYGGYLRWQASSRRSRYAHATPARRR